MGKVMVIYNRNSKFAQRFASVVNQREKMDMRVVPFSEWDSLKEYSLRHDIEILMISDEVAREQLTEIKAQMTILLAEENKEEGDVPAVYIYQSVDGMVRDVMSLYCARQPTKETEGPLKKARVIGIYSPISRCLKTSLALTLAQCLAAKEKVLYLNLENGSGLMQMIGKDNWTSDLSDVLYYFRQGELNPARMQTLSYNWKDLEIIPPIQYPEDFEGLTGEETAKLIRDLCGCGYNTLIVDVGSAIHQVLPILEICQVIYMPVREEPLSAGKLMEFENRIGEKMPDLIKQIQKLKLPYHSSFGNGEHYLEELMWSELGDYVRELAQSLQGKGECN